MREIVRNAFILTLICVTVFVSQNISACTIPVFRYALERWFPDPYGVLVFHRGPLSAAELEALDYFDAHTADSDLPANLTVEIIDVSAKLNEKHSALYKSLAPKELPGVVLRYPWAQQNEPPIWTGPLTLKTVRSLVDSPVRRKIAQRLLAGEAAVWVLVESGKRDDDDAAARCLLAELKVIEKALEDWSPDVAEWDDGEFSAQEAEAGEAQQQPAPVLSFTFPLVRFSRTDPAEKIFLAMLLHGETDNKPTVFPVFGRGRALCALAGTEIAKENIEEACHFLAGACSCAIKAMNPGVDLLIAANWDKAVEESLMADPIIPDLTGVIPDSPVGKDAGAMPETGAPSVATANGEGYEPGQGGSERSGSQAGLVRTLILVLAGIAVFVIAGGTILARRGSSHDR